MKKLAWISMIWLEICEHYLCITEGMLRISTTTGPQLSGSFISTCECIFLYSVVDPFSSPRTTLLWPFSLLWLGAISRKWAWQWQTVYWTLTLSLSSPLPLPSLHYVFPNTQLSKACNVLFWPEEMYSMYCRSSMDLTAKGGNKRPVNLLVSSRWEPVLPKLRNYSLW